MRHPAPVTCDRCGQPIDTEKPWTSYVVAVPEDVAEDIRAEWAKQPRPTSIFGFQVPLPAPTHLHLDICRACEDPDLRPLVAVKVVEHFENQRRKAEKPHAKARFGGDE